MVQQSLTFASGLQSSSSVDGIPKEAVARHLDTHHTRTAGACIINSEVCEDRAVTPAGPPAGGAESATKEVVARHPNICGCRCDCPANYPLHRSTTGTAGTAWTTAACEEVEVREGAAAEAADAARIRTV
jgi:hypothetical protein